LPFLVINNGSPPAATASIRAKQRDLNWEAEIECWAIGTLTLESNQA
jgi:hypothetical protein